MRSSSDLPAGSAGEARSETYTVWLTADQLREDRVERSVIIDREAKKLYVVKHREKIYHALDLPIDTKKLIPPDVADWYASTRRLLMMEVTVTRTDETRELGGYAARKHVAQVSNRQGKSMSMDVWTTTEAAIDAATYKSLMLELAGLSPTGSEWIRKLYEVEGFPVLIERTVDTPAGQLHGRDELAGVEQKDPPPGIFLPPQDYALEEFNFLREAPSF